jgi:hypothetical protein
MEATMTKPDLTAARLTDLVKSDKQIAVKYAAEVLRDKPAEYFLDVLSNLIDDSFNGDSFTINNPRGQPRKDFDEELAIGKFVINAIEENKTITGEEDVDLAVAVAMAEFGIERSTAFAAYTAIKGDLLLYQLDIFQPSSGS